MESRVEGRVSRLVGTGLMSVRVPYVRLVGGWEVHLCDAVDDRLLRLASWRRPGVPDSESHKRKPSSRPSRQTHPIDNHQILNVTATSILRHRIPQKLEFGAPEIQCMQLVKLSSE